MSCKRPSRRTGNQASSEVVHGRCTIDIDAVTIDGDTMRLCRLRYGGSAHQWGFAIYRASHDDYDDSYLPSGYPVGTCEEALDPSVRSTVTVTPSSRAQARHHPDREQR